MPAPDKSGDAVNLKELKTIMDDDLALIEECFGHFIDEWPTQYAELKGAVLEKNAQKLDTSAHKLKGTLKCLAAKPSADAAFALETAGRENNLIGTEKKLEHLKNECEKLLNYIHHFNG